jgi:glutamyl-tRNA reductase
MLPTVNQAAILSTCNRTELYCDLQDDHVEALTEWLARFHALDPADIRPHLYSFPDADAVRHLLRVAGGLDSMILGEPQILGQMKAAYQNASDAGTLDAALERLFQHTFAVAKQIRTDTAIGESPVSVAFAAVSRAHQLATQFNGYGISLDEIPAHLAEADIVISATGSEGIILDRKTVKPALKRRKHRPVFMVDIAVPRDIDPAVAKFEDIYLYTVDDLQEVIKENLKSREEAARQAEEIVEVQAERFMAWLRAQGAVSSIRNYRDRAAAHRDEVLAKAQHMLANGRDPDEVLQFLANTLTNKLTHVPSVQIRQAAETGDTLVLQAALQLFNLNKD